MVPIGLHHRLDFGRGGEVRCLTPSPPIEHFFGRNSEPPGSFQEIFGYLEPGDRCATFVLSRLPMFRPPAAAIRDLLVLGGRVPRGLGT